MSAPDTDLHCQVRAHRHTILVLSLTVLLGLGLCLAGLAAYTPSPAAQTDLSTAPTTTLVP